MTGEYQHSLDNKGRLFIPAKLRDELGEVFYITLSMDRCLCAYSGEAWRALSEKVDAMPYIKQRKMRPLFAHAARCELDAQGRALIPQNLREYAGFTKNVTVVGCNNHAELWDSESNQVGLHARPATFFIQKANEFKSSIWVEKEERRVNAKSLLGVLSLGIVKGTAITIIADGADEEEAIATLSELIDSDFSE